ncbi:MAG TPA: ornithine cyclodeaminase family protein [Candidatus Nanopelagicaceae bacterium]|nr:ornithine cyclodeaminase family protein [Candidatus Nanopelagicaceae bacterium]
MSELDQPDPEGHTLVLAAHEVERLLRESPLVDAVAQALRAYSDGSAVAPPRVAATTPAGLLAAMPAYLPGVALSTKLITVFPDNQALGRPSHQGIVALFDETDGRLLCLMDAAPITAHRTAAVSALSVALLAQPESHVLAVLGAGVQARSHLDLLLATGRFDQVRIASRHPVPVSNWGHPQVQEATSFEAAVTMADVVVCCTNANSPILAHGWLEPGCHVISVGSGAELDPPTVSQGAVFVEWRGAVTTPPPAGAAELQGRDPLTVTELGEVLADPRRGRDRADRITVFKSTGLAVEDSAAARLVYDAAQRQGVGRNLQW